MRHVISSKAFSLIEVVIAVGVFASGIVVLLALLPAMLQRSADSGDTLTALRLPDAIRSELLAIGGANPVSSIGGRIADLGTLADDKLRLVATHDGADVRELGIDSRDKYFLIEVFRFTSGQLAFNAAAPVLAMQVRVSWPYQPLGAAAISPPEARSSVTFSLALLP